MAKHPKHILIYLIVILIGLCKYARKLTNRYYAVLLEYKVKIVIMVLENKF